MQNCGNHPNRPRRRVAPTLLALAAGCALAGPLVAQAAPAMAPPSVVAGGSALDNVGCATPLAGNACIRLDCGGECNDVAASAPEWHFPIEISAEQLAAMGYAACTIQDLGVAVELTAGDVNTVTLGQGLDSAVLWTGGGVCGATSLDATFDDEASAAPNACPAQRRLRPNDALATFDGRNLVGTWDLHVGGAAALLEGTFRGWRLAADVQCATRPPGSCAENGSTACLNRSRFRVRMTYRTAQGVTGNAHANPLTPDTSWFWFFDRGNVEVVVKVIDGCALNQRFWVFASGLTNVAVETTVVDTVTGRSRTYRNPLDRNFRPIQDTAAFRCP